jgi:hypothetical protein
MKFGTVSKVPFHPNVLNPEEDDLGWEIGRL